MTLPTIRDAASAIAASHCLLARMATSEQGIARAAHDRECAFCGSSAAELSAAVDDFWAWSGSTHAVEIWEQMPVHLKYRHLAEAQGYREPRTIQAEEK
jgi:hypothetical protein